MKKLLPMLSLSIWIVVPRSVVLVYLNVSRYLPASSKATPQLAMPPFWPAFSTMPPSMSDDWPTKNVTVSVVCVYLLHAEEGIRHDGGLAGGLVPGTHVVAAHRLRVSTDLQGRQLVADGMGSCYVLSDKPQQSWIRGTALTKNVADSICAAYGLSARPTALAFSQSGDLWFSTGKDIRRMRKGKEKVMTYKDGELATDEYGSNEFGDGVTQLDIDSLGRLLLVSDRYARLYDPVRRTLRQQSREEAGVYCIEMQETQPGRRWSQPEEPVVERMPTWMWWALAVLVGVMVVLMAYIRQLHRQRERFLATMTQKDTDTEQTAESKPAEKQPQHDTLKDNWLQKAIAQVEAHLADDGYSVEQLAADMCMSRMTFYRRIQSATGQKPTEFIRTIRLRRAAELLREGRMSITEISYATGFSSVSYFSRCFRTMYGVPPKQYAS